MIYGLIPKWARRDAKRDSATLSAVVPLDDGRLRIATAICQPSEGGRPGRIHDSEAGNARELEGSLESVDCIVMQAAGLYGANVVDDWVSEVLYRAASRGSLLIFDESVSAFGRLGYPFVFQRLDVVPDIVFLGTSVSNGMLLAWPVVVNARVAETMPASANVELADREWIAAVLGSLAVDVGGRAARAQLMRRGLTALLEEGLITGLRGGGWAYAITPSRPVGDRTGIGSLLESLRREELWLPASAGGDLLLLPPVNSAIEQVAGILDGLHAGLTRWQRLKAPHQHRDVTKGS